MAFGCAHSRHGPASLEKHDSRRSQVGAELIATSTSGARLEPPWRVKRARAGEGRVDLVSSRGTQLELDWLCSPEPEVALRAFDALVAMSVMGGDQVISIDSLRPHSAALVRRGEGWNGAVITGTTSRSTFFAACGPFSTRAEAQSCLDSVALAAPILDAIVGFGVTDKVCPSKDRVKPLEKGR